MRLQTGVITVATAGTAVVADNTANRVYEITFKALAGNSGLVILEQAQCLLLRALS